VAVFGISSVFVCHFVISQWGVIVILVDVEDEKVVTVSREGKRDIFIQQAWAWLSDRDGCRLRHPALIKVYVESVGEPYPTGHYTVAPSSFRVNQWGRLELSFVRLQRAQSKVKAA